VLGLPAKLFEAKNYTKKFFSIREEGAIMSAKVIVPIIRNLFSPQSVIDVGCGNGTWLYVFSECGIDDFIGIDWGRIDETNLLIPIDNFISCDLSCASYSSSRKFDVAISLEVAEHIHSDKADEFIKMLCEFSDIIIFSAAIPNQGGVDHLNEQWQSYWAGKFNNLGYICHDPIRSQIWGNDKVKYWYAQNILVYIKRELAMDKYKDLQSPIYVDLVHPRTYLKITEFFIVKLLLKIFFAFKKMYLRL
jgi:hypothetical protein